MVFWNYFVIVILRTHVTGRTWFYQSTNTNLNHIQSSYANDLTLLNKDVIVLFCLIHTMSMLLIKTANFLLSCKLHYIGCLKKKLGSDNSLSNAILWRHLRKKKSLIIVICFLFLWNFNKWWRIGSCIILLDIKIT